MWRSNKVRADTASPAAVVIVPCDRSPFSARRACAATESASAPDPRARARCARTATAPRGGHGLAQARHLQYGKGLGDMGSPCRIAQVDQQRLDVLGEMADRGCWVTAGLGTAQLREHYGPVAFRQRFPQGSAQVADRRTGFVGPRGRAGGGAQYAEDPRHTGRLGGEEVSGGLLRRRILVVQQTGGLKARARPLARLENGDGGSPCTELITFIAGTRSSVGHGPPSPWVRQTCASLRAGPALVHPRCRAGYLDRAEIRISPLPLRVHTPHLSHRGGHCCCHGARAAGGPRLRSRQHGLSERAFYPTPWKLFDEQSPAGDRIRTCLRVRRVAGAGHRRDRPLRVNVLPHQRLRSRSRDVDPGGEGRGAERGRAGRVGRHGRSFQAVEGIRCRLRWRVTRSRTRGGPRRGFVMSCIGSRRSHVQ
ncbi:hypothetical protein FBY35_1262 [Streptomyces sp. SLBN-118]|nr:hypothetical protein FBY35_1262 [Streptomyces sp. SLBN-118]